MSRRNQEIWRAYETAWLHDHAITHRNLKRRYQKIFKQSDADDEDETSGERHLVDELADLLVEAGSSDGVTREQALQWLLHSRDGQALVGRMMSAHRKRATSRKGFQMTRSEQLHSVVKQAGGLMALCRRIAKSGSSGGVAEAELVGMLLTSARLEYPHLTGEAAFTKMFCGPDGEVLRRAVQVAKFAQLYGAK
jgi:hypothetical protein